MLGDRDLLLISSSYFLNNYLFYFFFNWLYIYLVDVRKFTLLAGGAFAAAPWIAGAGGAVDRRARVRPARPPLRHLRGLSGRLDDRSGARRRLHPGGGAAANPYVAVVLLSLCLASQQFTDSAAWAATHARGRSPMRRRRAAC